MAFTRKQTVLVLGRTCGSEGAACSTEAGTPGLEIAGKYGNLFFITFFFEIAEFSGIKFSFRDTCSAT